MFDAIRSLHRPTTPIARVTAALPDLPHRHRKRRRRVGAAAIVRAFAGLVAVLIGTAAVILRERLASIVRRRGGGEEQAPDGTLTPDASEAESRGPLRSRASVARVRRGLTRLPRRRFPTRARSGRRSAHLAEK